MKHNPHGVDSIALILEKAKRGDSDAYDALVNRFQDMAIGFAYSILGDIHSAEDAAQEAFLAIRDDLSQLRNPEAFPAWFRTVVFKHCDRQKRRKRPATLSLADADTFASEHMGPDEIVAAEELKRIVREEIQDLPEQQRVVTELYYLESSSQQEIAETLHIPISTVKNRLRASRKRLRERMAETIMEPHEPETGDRFVPPLGQMTPLLTVFNVRRSIAFYRDVLGFEVEGTFEWRGGFGWASMTRGPIRLMLNAAVPPDDAPRDEDRTRSRGVTFYLAAERVEEVRVEFMKRGYRVGKLFETYYGMRQFALFDPDGYKLILQEPILGERSPSAKWGTA